MSKKGKLSILILSALILIIVASFFYSSSEIPPNFSSTHKIVSLFLSDPFSLPVGTNAIILNYSKITLFSTVSNKQNSTSLISNGYAEFYSSENTTTLLGYVYVPLNSTLNNLTIKLNGAAVEINNTFYNLSIPNKTVRAAILSNGTVIQNTTVVAYFSGAVLPIFLNNSIRFFSEPSAIATSFSSNNSNKKVQPIINYKNISIHKISIENAKLSSDGNKTLFAITLMDNSSLPVFINTISISGKMGMPDLKNSSALNITEIGKLKNIINYSFINNITKNVNTSSINGYLSSILNYLKPISSKLPLSSISNSLSGITGYIGQNLSSSLINKLESINYSFIGKNIPKNLSQNLTYITKNIEDGYLNSLDYKEGQLATVAFIPEMNGTLLVPSSNMSSIYSGGAYILPKEATTFTYYGGITFAGNSIFIPIQNNNYTIWIMGTNSIAFNKNITAV